MPKLRPSDSEMQNRLSRSVIEKHLALEAINKEKLAKLIGVSRATMHNRCNSPDTLTAREIRRIASKLGLNKQEILELCGIEWKEG